MYAIHKVILARNVGYFNGVYVKIRVFQQVVSNACYTYWFIYLKCIVFYGYEPATGYVYLICAEKKRIRCQREWSAWICPILHGFHSSGLKTCLCIHDVRVRQRYASKIVLHALCEAEGFFFLIRQYQTVAIRDLLDGYFISPGVESYYLKGVSHKVAVKNMHRTTNGVPVGLYRYNIR